MHIEATAEVRGEPVVVVWQDGELHGDREALERLRRRGDDVAAEDPVEFLQLVRDVFGEVHTHVVE